MDADSMVNPAVPASTGALLAEEWTINPMATLPSFLEMVMIDEASRSARKSLDAGVNLLKLKLAARGDADSSNRDSVISQAVELLRKHLERILDRFGPEISGWILYRLECRSLRSDACATLSASLYGGRLEKLDPSSEGTHRKLLPLTDRDKTGVALLAVLGPYFRHRLLLWYQTLKRRQEFTQGAILETSPPAWQKFQKLLLVVYPLLHASMSGLDLLYQWRYLLGHTIFFHPSAHLLGLVLRRVTQEDCPPSDGPSPNPRGSVSNDPSTRSLSWRNMAAWGLSSAVILSWLSHFRAEFRRQRQELLLGQQPPLHPLPQPQNAAIHMQIPAPPASAIQNALPAHLCPLCGLPRVHPTASSSGFVFCFKCLLQHVREKATCPVTGRTCKEAQLLRLYEPNYATGSTPQI